MVKLIGYGDFNRGWEGPIALEFKLFREHTKTARYRCILDTRVFDLYAPLFMLDGLSPKALPETIVAVIGKSPGPLRTIGFKSIPTKLIVESDVCEYEFAESMANSEKYNLIADGVRYSLYVPNEIFEDDARPSRLFLRIALPSDKSSEA